MEPRIRELREEFALRKIPTASFTANALYLEIVRLAYNLVTAFQRTCLDESWQALTLQKLRYKLFSHSRRTNPPTKPARAQTQALTNDRESRGNDTRQGQQIEGSSALPARFHAGSKY